MIDMRLKRFGEWTFERVGGLCRLRGLHDLAFAASASTAGSGIAGVDIMGVPSAVAPADTDVQFMRLRFRSRGFFRAEPGAHLALGVAGQWRKANPAMQTMVDVIDTNALPAGAYVVRVRVVGTQGYEDKSVYLRVERKATGKAATKKP